MFTQHFHYSICKPIIETEYYQREVARFVIVDILKNTKLLIGSRKDT